jgi:hypothetical protein
LFKHGSITIATAAILVSAALFLVPAAIPFGHAYGQAQWQVAFSGNSNNSTTHVRSGFWGWCEFGGSAADGQSGTDADCQVTTYFFNGTGANTGNLFHQSVHGTFWSLNTTTFPPLPGLPTQDFFITKGTMTLTGPLVVKFISSSGNPPPPGCALIGQSATCPLSVWEGFGLYNPDTGIPAAPGHYSFANLLEAIGMEVPPGTHINIQVNQL